MNKKKTFSEKLVLALPGSGITLSQTLISAVFVKYFTDIIGLSTFYAGLLFLIYNIWNYINDPFIGVFVDRFKYNERRGKYVFLMRCALPFMVLFLVLLTLGSPTKSQLITFIILCIEFFIYDTAATLFNVSYISYYTVVAPTNEDRIDIEVPRNIMANIFSALVSLTGSFLLVGGASSKVVVPVIISIVAINAVLYIVGVIFFKEKKEIYTNVDGNDDFSMKGVGKNLSSIFKMKSFWTWFVFSIFALGCMEFYYTPFLYFMDWVVKTDSNSFRSLMTLIADNLPSISMLILLPFIAKWIKKNGSKQSIIIAYIPYLIGFAILFFTSNAYVVVACYILILFGRKIVGTAKIPLSYAIIDENEMLTGERKPGLITGLLQIISAPVQAMQSAIFLFIIGFYGYDSQKISAMTESSGKDAARDWLINNTHAILGIRIGVSVVPIVCTLIGLVALLLFPYNKKREKEIADFTRKNHS